MCTWSILRRSGNRLTLRQHSGPPRPDSGITCSAFTVNYSSEWDRWEHEHKQDLIFFLFLSVTHHVGVGSARHALTGVLVQELVDLRGSQTVSHLKFLDDKHLSGNRLLPKAWSFCIQSCSRGRHHWVRLMLETDLKREKEVRNKAFWIFKWLISVQYTFVSCISISSVCCRPLPPTHRQEFWGREGTAEREGEPRAPGAAERTLRDTNILERNFHTWLFRAFVFRRQFGIYEHSDHAWIHTKTIGSRSPDRGGLILARL